MNMLIRAITQEYAEYRGDSFVLSFKTVRILSTYPQ